MSVAVSSGATVIGPVAAVGTGPRTVFSSTTIEEGAVQSGSVFSGWVALCKLPNGDALAAWARASLDGGPDETDHMYTSFSSDGGATWAAPVLVYAATGTDTVSPTGLTALADGSVLLAFVIGDVPNVIRSADNAATWSSPFAITTSFTGAFGFQSSAPLQLADNSVLMGMYGLDTGSSQRYIRIMKSAIGDTARTTWTDTGVALRATVGTDLMEPWLCLLDDGRLLMTIRQQPTGASGNTGEQLWTSYSSDHGATWTTPALAIDKTGASPSVIQTPELDVLVLSRDLLSVGHSEPIVFQSADRGATWDSGTPLAAFTLTYFYGQMGNIGPANTDGSIALATGQTGTGGAPDCDAVLYTFTKRERI